MTKKKKTQIKKLFPPTLRTEEISLVDGEGRIRAVLSARDGVPTLTFYDSRRRIRFWLTLDANGTPDLRFFGPNGKTCTMLRS